MTDEDESAKREDESSWIPLTPDEHGHLDNDEPSVETTSKGEIPRVANLVAGQGNGSADDDGNPLGSDRYRSFRSRRASREKTGDSDNNHGSGKSSSRLRSIQRKLENKVFMRTHLVNHPVEYFWQRCLVNLLREVWGLEIHIKLGIIMLVTGILTRIFLWSTWYLLYPRFAILSLALVVGMLYLDPLDLQEQMKDARILAAALFSPSSSQEQKQIVEGIQMYKIQRLAFVLYAIPTVLKIRTFSFLSRLNAEMATVGSTRLPVFCYDTGVALSTLGVMIFLHRVRGMNPCDASYRGLLTLYGFSLLITIVNYGSTENDLRQIPFLAAPFLTATATLLLTCKGDSSEWFSRIIRHAFRLSLRDVFSSVSERVSQDEMLQLAILRWICDYWASSPTPTAGETARKPKKPMPSSTSSSTDKRQSTTEPSPPSPAETTPPPKESTDNPPPFEHEVICWEELQPMLNVEIDHMKTEIDALQLRGNDSTSSHKKQSGPIDIPVGTIPISKPETSLCEENNQNHDMDSLMALKSMLLSLNVDERAQPAVLAFRRAVESFPPKKKTAVTVSMLCRCPALITVIFHMFFLSDVSSLFMSTLLLSPFLLMEYYRINEWMEGCQRFVPISRNEMNEEQDWRIPASLKHADTMTILLSADMYNAFRPPSLLMVWYNVVNSVSALEAGLSTARCAETTAVAIEFAGSAMSLVKFGFEVSENGLFHGLTVLVKEVLSIHANGKDISKLDFLDDGSAQYTSAAIRAVQQGQKVVSNIHTLSEDQNIVPIVQPLLNFFGMLNPHNWGGEKKEEGQGDDSSKSPDGNSEAPLNEAESQDEKKENLDRARESMSEAEPQEKKNENLDDARDHTNDDESRARDKKKEYPDDARDGIRTVGEGGEANGTQTTKTPSEVLNESGTSEISKSVSKGKSGLIPNAPAFENNLSTVVEMIAKSYEEGLIEEEEKNCFFQKLSELQKEELHDPAVLSAMKRTLTILLQNGEKASTIDNTIILNAVHEDCTDDKNTIESKNENEEWLALGTMDGSRNSTSDSDKLNLSHSEKPSSSDSQEMHSKASRSNEQNDNSLALSLAALGVVATGVAVMMGGNAQRNDSEDHFFGTQDSTDTNKTYAEDVRKKSSSTMTIVELDDDNSDDDWVPLH